MRVKKVEGEGVMRVRSVKGKELRRRRYEGGERGGW